MKRFGWQWLVVSSLSLGALLINVSSAESRPQYGGTVHVAVREVPMSLDPSDTAQADSFARRDLLD